MPVVSPGKEALEKLAHFATKKLNLAVSLGSQSDLAFNLRCPSIHPMQVLENVHQSQVRRETQKNKYAADPDGLQEAEKDALGEFYTFNVSETTLMAPNVGDPLINDRLTEVDGKLRTVLKVIKAEQAKNVVDNTILTSAQGDLEAVRAELDAIRVAFGFTTGDVSLIDEVETLLTADDGDPLNPTTVADRIAAATDWAALKREYKNGLAPAVQHLTQAISGRSRITMLYNISPFYLFRLMVQYRLEKATQISDGNRRKVSGFVTEHLNNEQWVCEWLARTMETIAGELGALPNGMSEHVFFHLKGGRALALLLGTNGVNDWDTSIVINPELPAADYYRIYATVHDVVLRRLEICKREFFKQVTQHAATLDANVDNLLQQTVRFVMPDPTPNDSVVPFDKANCKAELIDIGIPRRDTIEAFEQWHHTRDKLIVRRGYNVADVPIPSHLYYVEEYVMMVREALAERSPSLHKTPKRIQRLARVLHAQGIDDEVGKVRKKITGGSAQFARPLQRVDAKGDAPVKRMMTLILEEFIRAYRLAKMPGLAYSFNELFYADGATPSCDPYPQPVIDGRTEYLQEKGTQEWGDTHCEALLTHIGFAKHVADKIEPHLVARAAHFGYEQKTRDDEAKAKRRKKIGALIKALYTATAFVTDEELQVQLAVTGAYAAYLHADYSHWYHKDRDESSLPLGDQRNSTLDPVTFVSLTLYCHESVTVGEQEVYDIFLKGPLSEYIQRSGVEFSMSDLTTDGKGSAYLMWPTEEDFGDDFTYKPLIMEITVVKGKWPKLDFIWGFPVLSLPELIADYIHRAANAGEYETKIRLRSTVTNLQDLLTRYEPPKFDRVSETQVVVQPLGGNAPVDPHPGISDATFAALENATASYLMVSWHGRANGGAVDYPDSYPEDEQHLITVTDMVTAGQSIGTLVPQVATHVLELLVVNQGHGGVGHLFDGTIDAQSVTDNLVRPLIDAGFQCKRLVIDACLSASVAEAFAPLLCDDNPILFATMYTTNSLLVTTDTWAKLREPIDRSDGTEITDILITRGEELSRGNTGLALSHWFDHLVDQLNQNDNTGLEQLWQTQAVRDVMSAALHIPEIRAALETYGTNYGAIYDYFETYGDSYLHANDKAVLDELGDERDEFDDSKYQRLVSAFKARLHSLLGSDTYGIELPSSDYTQRSVFGRNSLGTLWQEHRYLALASVDALPRCPSTFAVFGSNYVECDSELLAGNGMSNSAQTLLGYIDNAAVQDVAQVLALIDNQRTRTSHANLFQD